MILAGKQSIEADKEVFQSKHDIAETLNKLERFASRTIAAQMLEDLQADPPYQYPRIGRGLIPLLKLHVEGRTDVEIGELIAQEGKPYDYHVIMKIYDQLVFGSSTNASYQIRAAYVYDRGIEGAIADMDAFVALLKDEARLSHIYSQGQGDGKDLFNKCRLFAIRSNWDTLPYEERKRILLSSLQKGKPAGELPKYLALPFMNAFYRFYAEGFPLESQFANTPEQRVNKFRSGLRKQEQTLQLFLEAQSFFTELSLIDFMPPRALPPLKFLAEYVELSHQGMLDSEIIEHFSKGDPNLYEEALENFAKSTLTASLILRLKKEREDIGDDREWFRRSKILRAWMILNITDYARSSLAQS